MASAQYEEAMMLLNNARREEQKMSEQISVNARRKNSKSEELVRLNGQVRNVSHALAVLENALKRCGEIKDSYFPNMKSELEAASSEYAKTFVTDIDNVNLQTIYEDDINQTQKEIADIYTDLQEKVNKLKTQEANLNEDISTLKRDISNLSTLIAEYTKRRNLYSSQVEEYTSMVKKTYTS